MNRNPEEQTSHILSLEETDNVDIVSVIDNSIDYLSQAEKEEVKKVRTWVSERKTTDSTETHFISPLAEHGFSMLVRVRRGRISHSVLFDTGASSDGIAINASRMKLDLSEAESIIISHGHHDHFGGLLTAVRMIGKDNLPIIVHNHMFRPRRTLTHDGKIRRYIDFPSDNQIKPARYISTKQPYMISDNMVLITGEIPRRTDFEKGLPRHEALIDDRWQPDPLIMDERALIINIKNKGLMIVSGCAHAGIINTINHARQLTGVTKVHAVIGGFHLVGDDSNERIKRTVTELKMLNPKLVAPTHCTGWRGACAIYESMPNAFVWNSVGNRYQF